jgi:hypothetical protein
LEKVAQRGQLDLVVLLALLDPLVPLGLLENLLLDLLELLAHVDLLALLDPRVETGKMVPLDYLASKDK